MSYSKTGFACDECVDYYVIEADPATAPTQWILRDGGPDHKVRQWTPCGKHTGRPNVSWTATIPCGEACEHCGKLEPVRGEGMNLTWSYWTELEV